MSTDDTTKGIESMRDSGKLSHSIARAAINHPLEGEKILRMDRIEEKQDDMWRALFGDERQELPGIVSDVRFLKTNFWRGIWTVAGGMAVGGFFIAAAATVFGLWIEYSKH
jgi:hypothetical protein